MNNNQLKIHSKENSYLNNEIENNNSKLIKTNYKISKLNEENKNKYLNNEENIQNKDKTKIGSDILKSFKIKSENNENDNYCNNNISFNNILYILKKIQK